MLRESLISMLLFNLGSRRARAQELEQLAERHSRRQVDIPPRLYDLWLDSLCETVEQHDPEFKPELGEPSGGGDASGDRRCSVSKY